MLYVFLFLFAPLSADYEPPVGEKFWLVSETAFDCWEAEVVERKGQAGRWYKYPSFDGLVINDHSLAPRSYVYRCKIGCSTRGVQFGEASRGHRYC